jgi:hypothetical protein
MNPEHMFNPGEHDTWVHPEVVEDFEGAIPATDQTKLALLDAVDATLARNAAHECVPGLVAKVRDVFYEDSSILVMRYLKGLGNLTASVIQTTPIKGNWPGACDRYVRNAYHISKTPDGLGIERSHSAPSSMMLHILPRNPGAALDKFAGIAEELERMKATVGDKYFGFTMASEREVKDLAFLAYLADPPLDEPFDVKFSREEEYRKSIANKTRQDEGAREPDNGQAEFMARAMSLDMARLALEVATLGGSKMLVAQLEAQAELKAIQAKFAYEEGSRSLAAVFGPDSPEAMMEDGWHWIANINRAGEIRLDDPNEYVDVLANTYGRGNVTTRPAQDIHQNPIANRLGVFIKEDVWRKHQRAIESS